MLRWNADLVPPPRGFMNLGVTCYLNSALQCILTCTSLFEMLQQQRDTPEFRANIIAVKLLEMHERGLAHMDTSRDCIVIAKILAHISSQRDDPMRMTSGQQDAQECMSLIFDELSKVPGMEDLFRYRHRVEIFCHDCDSWVSNREEEFYFFEVQADLKTEQHERNRELDPDFGRSVPLNKYLRQQNTFVDADYKCPNCGERGVKYKTTKVVMIGEILPVMLKKYGQKNNIAYPSTLSFPACNGTVALVYELVARAEHSGSLLGGHYWADAVRTVSDGTTARPRWAQLNDMSVSPSRSPTPTANSYLLMYHYVGQRNMM